MEEINYAIEYEKLNSSLMNLKILKPILYRRIYHTGMLFQELCHDLGDSFTPSNDYILAAFYANMGWLSIEDSIYKEKYVVAKDLEIIKRHVRISADLLNEKGLHNIAAIVLKHHEKPDGSGYLKEQNIDPLIAVMNIADEFLDGVLVSQKPEAPLLYEEAIEVCLRGYKSHTLLRYDEVGIIKETLFKYFKRYIRE